MINLIVLLLSVLPAILILRKSRGDSFNSGIIFLCIGYVFYAGYCIFIFDLPIYYLWMYLIFSFIFFVTLNLSYKLLYKVGISSGAYFGDFFDVYLNKKNKNIIIFLYVGLSVYPLLFPEFRIFDLFNPPIPDLKYSFELQFENIEKPLFSSLVDLIKQLLLPFFLIALYSRSKKILFPFLVLTLVFYIEYVVSKYKSRGQLIVNYFPLLFFYWCNFKERRWLVISIGLVLIPSTLLLFNFYEIYRLDSAATIGQFDVWKSGEHIIRVETGFVDSVGVPLIESGARVDLLDYFKWIVTLPIPKFLFGDIAGARINTEISEIILDVGRGGTGFYIVLPGLIAESVYIYGVNFFWLHALMLGILMAFLLRLFGGNEEFIYLIGYIFALAMYNLNRGGIASFLPQIINQLFLLYVIFAAYKFKLIQKKPPAIKYFSR